MWKEKKIGDHKPRTKQARISQLGKHSYSKTIDLVMNFEIEPANYLTKTFILKLIEAAH